MRCGGLGDAISERADFLDGDRNYVGGLEETWRLEAGSYAGWGSGGDNVGSVEGDAF